MTQDTNLTLAEALDNVTERETLLGAGELPECGLCPACNHLQAYYEPWAENYY